MLHPLRKALRYHYSTATNTSTYHHRIQTHQRINVMIIFDLIYYLPLHLQQDFEATPSAATLDITMTWAAD